VDEIEELLETLPSDLEGAYDQALAAIHKKDGNAGTFAERAFQWVLSCPTPLDISYLGVAVCQDPTKPFDATKKKTGDYVLSVCQNLLVANSGWVGFSHLSVQEYFDKKWQWKEQKGAKAHAHVAKVCLRALTDPCLPYESLETREYPRKAYKHCFYLNNYIDNYWHDRARRCDTYPDAELTNLMNTFFGQPNKSSRYYRHWVSKEALDGLPPIARDKDKPFLACVFLGLSRQFNIWRESHPDLLDANLETSDGYHIIELATSHSSFDIFASLLELGANLHARVKHNDIDKTLTVGQSSLYRATLCQVDGSPNKIQALLDKGVDPNFTVAEPNLTSYHSYGGRDAFYYPGRAFTLVFGGTLLQILARNSLVEQARCLLSAGVDISPVHPLYGTALHCAVSSGMPKIVQLLLEEGADVQAKGGKYGTVLKASENLTSQSARDREPGWDPMEVVRLLLDAGAEMEPGDNRAALIDRTQKKLDDSQREHNDETYEDDCYPM
jgi:hypothetical protein